MRVKTLDEEAFVRECGQLKEMVRTQAGQWSVVIGIATGGLYVARFFEAPGILSLSIKKQRTGTDMKKRFLPMLVRLFPRPVTNMLRILESKIYARRYRAACRADQSLREPRILPLPEEFRSALINWRDSSKPGGGRFSRHPLILIVDDAADSGTTLRDAAYTIRTLCPDARVLTAVITATRPEGSRYADFALYRDGTLIRFPWAADN